jgi:hypothetical protein
MDSILREARDNRISPENLYSTEEILRIAGERGDSVSMDGDIIYVKPTSTQPIEYQQFAKSNICITDPSQRDWGDIQNTIIPNGGGVLFIFTKSEARSKRKMPASNFIIAVDYPYTVQQFGGAEQTAQLMYDRGKSVIGDAFTHTYEDLLHFVKSMVDGNNGELMENYDCENNLIPFDVLDSHLMLNGSSTSSMKAHF